MGLQPKNLMRRLSARVLPAALLPLLVFGAFTLYAFFQTAEREALRSQVAMATLVGGQLEAEIDDVQAFVDSARGEFSTAERRTQESLRTFVKRTRTVASAFILDDGFKVVDTYPPNSRGIGSTFGVLSVRDFDAGVAVSKLAEQDLAPFFYVGARLANGRYLVAEVTPSSWSNLVRSTVDERQDLLVGLYPISKTANVVRLSAREHLPLSHDHLQQLKGDSSWIEVAGTRYLATAQRVNRLNVAFVVARSEAAILGQVRMASVVFSGAVALVAGLLLLTLGLYSRRVSRSVDGVVTAAEALTEGKLDARVTASASGPGEFEDLENKFNRMTDALQRAQLRIRVLNRTMSETFTCKDGDALFKKAVEIVCTQCRGDMAWFLPTTEGHSVAFADASVFVGLHAWLWRNHRIVSMDAEARSSWESEAERRSNDKVFSFVLKYQSRELGVLKVAYRSNPSEEMISLLHEVVALVEASLLKLEQVKLSAMVSTELEVADAVRRTVAEDGVPMSMRSRVAFHYEPSSRLGGDWFNVFQDERGERLYVVIGDVTGNGLVQGMVTTAVKGALDSISRLAHCQALEGFGPAMIMSLLESVVRRVAGSSELAMSCLAIEVDFVRKELRACNAGHTFPLLVRPAGETNVVSQLHKDQQPSLGQAGSEAHVYTDSVYELANDDILVIYSDGLSQAKALKSPIFGRFLFRSLRERRSEQDPQKVKDDILDMFRYYTQGRRIEDDVCFLVVQVEDRRERLSA